MIGKSVLALAASFMTLSLFSGALAVLNGAATGGYIA